MKHPDPDAAALAGRLAFIQQAERLKTVLRSGHLSDGRRESTAEHSWRLCLLAMALQDLLGELDFERVLKLCVVHDLGEALGGDLPAPLQRDAAQAQAKGERERRDLATLCAPLPEALRAEMLALWDEYEQAATPEARVVKALDKIETITQHNQGANPPDFDHAFNLGYGRRHAAAHPVVARLRDLVDAQTRARLAQALPPVPGPAPGDAAPLR